MCQSNATLGGGQSGERDSELESELILRSSPKILEWSAGWCTPTVTTVHPAPPAFIVFIKGTFQSIIRLSSRPSPAAIHFSLGLVRTRRANRTELLV